jgi:probable O-glycosylation ligase (exosortase A-associated)
MYQATARSNSFRPAPPPVAAPALPESAPAPRALYAGLWLFTLLLYVRPNEAWPGLFGTFPLTKIVAIVTLLAYGAYKLSQAAPLTHWPLELKLVLLIGGLGVCFIPFAAQPGDSVDLLTDAFFKVICIFVLLINLVDTPARLRALLKLVVLSGSLIALDAVRSYLAGEFNDRGLRITGMVRGIFGNPNDLATALNLLLPLAVWLALTSRGAARWLYGGCAALLGLGVVATFSRAGFLGLLASAGVLLWKAGRHERAWTVLGALVLAGVFLLVMPNGYSERVTTIFATSEDKTGSADERRELLKRAAWVALHHPLIGVGMGNFHIYSIHEKVAHNAYLEIAAELGGLGLLAYLGLLWAPWRTLRRLERATETAPAEAPAHWWLSQALQASFVAYLVCSFFASLQYQWFLYYLVAYVVVLRRLHPAEQGEAARAPVATHRELPPNRVHPRAQPWASALTDAWLPGQAVAGQSSAGQSSARQSGTRQTSARQPRTSQPRTKRSFYGD